MLGYIQQSMGIKYEHVPAKITDVAVMIQKGEVDPSMVATHRMPMSKAPEAFKMFDEKSDGCQRVILRP